MISFELNSNGGSVEMKANPLLSLLLYDIITTTIGWPSRT